MVFAIIFLSLLGLCIALGVANIIVGRIKTKKEEKKGD